MGKQIDRIITKPDAKVDLATLKASMVLGLGANSDGVQTVMWWRGVVKDEHNNNCVVLQVLRDDYDSIVNKANKVLSGYGIDVPNAVLGSTYDLLPIPIDRLTNVSPPRETRKWLNMFHYGPHDAWKRDVVTRLDGLGIDRLRMEYSGSGDNSNDDSWECHRSSQGGWHPKTWSDAEGKHWIDQNVYELPEDLRELISEYVWQTLIQHDCVNNDGGGGDLVIDLSNDEPDFRFTCYTNEMVSTTHEDNVEV